MCGSERWLLVAVLGERQKIVTAGVAECCFAVTPCARNEEIVRAREGLVPLGVEEILILLLFWLGYYYPFPQLLSSCWSI